MRPASELPPGSTAAGRRLLAQIKSLVFPGARVSRDEAASLMELTYCSSYAQVSIQSLRATRKLHAPKMLHTKAGHLQQLSTGAATCHLAAARDARTARGTSCTRHELSLQALTPPKSPILVRDDPLAHTTFGGTQAQSYRNPSIPYLTQRGGESVSQS